jgi:hypothetical protein
MESIQFSADTRSLEQWAKAWKEFPKEAGKWAAKFVNDEALQFKADFPDVIARHYILRNKKFIGGSVKVDLARPRSHMEDIVAVVGTVKKPRFSGFTEEVGGGGPRRTRAFTLAGRGGFWENESKGWARMHPSDDPTQDQRIPSTDLVLGLPDGQRFMALMNMIASKKIPIAPKANSFILDGGKYKRGLYRFDGKKFPIVQKIGKSGKYKGQKLLPRLDPDAKLNMVQIFKPIKEQDDWDWPGDVVKKVQKKFTPDYIWDNYIAKAMAGIMPEKKPRPKK